MPDTDGLLFSCVLDGEGGGRFGGWEQVRDWTPAQGLLWVHLNRTAETTRRWLEEESGLDEITCAALLADESRPRSLVRGDGLLVDLRGVNLNPGADSDDMISARMFVQESRVITLQRRRLMSIEDVKANVEAGRGPRDAGDFVVALADALDRRMAGSMLELEERVDSLDERTTSEAGSSLRAEISGLRREDHRAAPLPGAPARGLGPSSGRQDALADEPPPGAAYAKSQSARHGEWKTWTRRASGQAWHTRNSPAGWRSR